MIASSCKPNFAKRVKHELYITDSEAYSEPSQTSKMCVKRVRNRIYSGLYFPAFRLNTQ